MTERRLSERKQYSGSVHFSVSVLNLRQLETLNLSGDIANVSETGMCIYTAFPLEAGHVLKFSGGIRQKLGVVKWSANITDRTYKVGVKFV